MLHFLSISRILILATVIPVSIIAKGDIQSPSVVTELLINAGNLRPVRPMIIPIIIAINIGFKKFLSLDFIVGVPSSRSIRSIGTPHI